MAQADVPLLLSRQTFKAALSAQSFDFQSLVGRPARYDDDCMPCVMILTRADDREADYISLRLAAAGIPLLRIDSDRCAGTELVWDVFDGVVRLGGERFRPKVHWSRYFSASSIDAPAPDAIAHYVQEQWGAWAEGMQPPTDVVMVNRSTGRWRPSRTAQLAAARRAGLRVPAGVVTTCPGRAPDLIPGSGDLVLKSLGEHLIEETPGNAVGLFPRRVTRAELTGDRTVESAPVLIQDFVPSSAELRIHWADGAFIAFRLGKRSMDVERLNISDVSIEQVPMPPELTGPLTLLSEQWNLQLAAFDLLETPGGHVFLEVNPAFDWLWLEHHLAGKPVSTAVCDFLINAFEGISS
ncbi:hypothetical protein Sme01_21070 [Sphaerisporangium melleum]|uniref:ATP-grasp domain-containing protein n=1 Tax=Sphaerisporangium melleum TaxID=321316 RepID=A0A917RMS5_9ACTN|nr:hypothetical protein [Sphaerisporangium melleum]GGL15883.1 hypothetical protein GCM10007964_67330 [Sphaerisporangium melleum]GII69631.1 hypothetical protein Sme01_21070 [Sphaerisporangium melleum]